MSVGCVMWHGNGHWLSLVHITQSYDDVNDDVDDVVDDDGTQTHKI